MNFLRARDAGNASRRGGWLAHANIETGRIRPAPLDALGAKAWEPSTLPRLDSLPQLIDNGFKRRHAPLGILALGRFGREGLALGSEFVQAVRKRPTVSHQEKPY